VVALLILQPASQGFGQTPAPSPSGGATGNTRWPATKPGQQKTADPSLARVGARLQHLVVAARSGNQALAAAAQRGGVTLNQNRVKVTIETDPGATDAVGASLRTRNGQQTARYRALMACAPSISPSLSHPP
jgi:hypothetical protein